MRARTSSGPAQNKTPSKNGPPPPPAPRPTTAAWRTVRPTIWSSSGSAGRIHPSMSRTGWTAARTSDSGRRPGPDGLNPIDLGAVCTSARGQTTACGPQGAGERHAEPAGERHRPELATPEHGAYAALPAILALERHQLDRK